MSEARRVCLVGAGVIARTHADILARMPGTTVTAVVDPDRAAASRLAAGFGARCYADVAALLEADLPDAAHVLVPPDLHAAVALPLLRAGVAVLVEKPLAASAAEARGLVAAGGRLGVNQNFLHHPAFLRLKRAIRSLGPLRAVDCVFHVPLRQLAARQFGHWMFRQPKNLLLEQAVHPLSQILDLIGPARGDLRPGPAVEIAPGIPFHASAHIALDGAAPAQMQFAVGRSFPVWRLTALCDDGVAEADMLADRCTVHRRTRWLEPVDTLLGGLAAAAQVAGQSVRNAGAYTASLMKLRDRADPFYLSMKGSIEAFHAGRRDAPFGLRLVELCEELAERLSPARPAPAVIPRLDSACAVLGGTGFIGRKVVERLVGQGVPVAVMARNPANLPPPFDRVHLVRGDAASAADLARAIGKARWVINLAHGGAREAAEACREAGVERLIHASSIAALQLGGSGVVTDATPTDPCPDRRSDYARRKIAEEAALRRMGLPVVIVRPGLVVGAGASPFHSGVGFFNAEQHCLGWNDGTNPLPFVLVEDVADAIVAALTRAEPGACHNLVGEVRLTAREYIAALAEATGRPLVFHPQSVRRLYAVELAKWLVKRTAGRAAPAPSLHDLRSRGLTARFDTAETRRALGWRPVADRATFLRSAFGLDLPEPQREAAE